MWLVQECKAARALRQHVVAARAVGMGAVQCGDHGSEMGQHKMAARAERRGGSTVCWPGQRDACRDSAVWQPGK